MPLNQQREPVPRRHAGRADTLFVALVKLDDGSAKTTANGFATILNRFQPPKRLSMTYDQGRVMAQHSSLAQQANIKVYFAHPHSPWERGINENTNGLLRQYLPKGTDLSVFSQQQLDEIAMLLNARPRKSLGWKAAYIQKAVTTPSGRYGPSASYQTARLRRS